MDSGTRKRLAHLLLVLAVAIGGASVALHYRFDQTASHDRLAATRTSQELGALELTLERLHAAQAAYLGQAQDPETRMQQVDEAIDAASLALARFREQELSPAAQIRMDAAAGAFEVLVSADARARDAVRNDQRLVAADAIFLDSADALDGAAAEVAGARSVERASAEAAAAELSRLRLINHAASIGAIVILAVAVSRLRMQSAPSDAAGMARMLRELPPPVRNSSPQTAAPPVPAADRMRPAPDEASLAPEPGRAPGPIAAEPARPAPAIDLPAAAELCGDMARVIDARDLPALLARAVRVLDARGIIVWVADGDGLRLQPALTHGYADKVVRRLEALAADGDNVTSRAFRTRRVQQLDVTGDASHGAVAIPLVTATGCVGVLAAEVSPDGLASESVAVARILAAQFATLIAPDGTSASQVAEG